MKRIILALMLFAGFAGIGFSQSLGVFIMDNDGPYTNVRNAPKGKVIAKIPTKLDVILAVESPQNGWWKICNGTYSDMDNDETVMKGSKTGYWIHNSVLALGTRNYGGERLTLRKSPSAKSAAAYTFKEETMVHPIDIKGDWVKVKTEDGKHIGWIEIEWLCDNPVTNCC